MKKTNNDIRENESFSEAEQKFGHENFLTKTKRNPRRRETMKKLTAVAMVVMALASMTYAQKSGSSTTNVDAKIVQGLVVGNFSGDLKFGNSQNIIVQGADVASDFTVNPTSDSRAVDFKITGDGGQSVTVSYEAATKNLNSGANSLVYMPTTAWTTGSTQTGATSFSSGTSLGLGGSSYSPSSIYIWLGGNLNQAAVDAATPGYYTNTFTINVAYTGL
jgi:cytochrome c-type biogenesis protein CcmE